jgi:2-polyprenyl-3-methyl-5-hydroxy-6-metoxy-1,4-benzoquinol methylase
MNQLKMRCPWCKTLINPPKSKILYRDFYQDKELPTLVVYNCSSCRIWFTGDCGSFAEEYDEKYYSTLMNSVNLNKYWKKYYRLAYCKFKYPVYREKQKWAAVILNTIFYNLFKFYSNIEFSIPEYVQNGNILEVGCGRGSWLKKMRDLGWNVSGIEPSNFAVSEGDRTTLSIINQSADYLSSLNENSFNVIYSSFVLEHLSNIEEILHNMVRILKPGGELILSVPNGSSLAFKLFGKYWFNLDLPRHKVIFSPAFSNEIANKYNLKLIYCKCHSGTIGITISIVNIIRTKISQPLVQSLSKKILVNRLTHILLMSVIRLLDLISIGDTLHWRFRKI